MVPDEIVEANKWASRRSFSAGAHSTLKKTARLYRKMKGAIYPKHNADLRHIHPRRKRPSA